MPICSVFCCMETILPLYDIVIYGFPFSTYFSVTLQIPIKQHSYLDLPLNGGFPTTAISRQVMVGTEVVLLFCTEKKYLKRITWI